MTVFLRLFLLLICATVLTACSDYPSTDPQPKMKQEMTQSPTGQNVYRYRPVDSQ
jgi:hypothetical protein